MIRRDRVELEMERVPKFTNTLSHLRRSGFLGYVFRGLAALRTTATACRTFGALEASWQSYMLHDQHCGYAARLMVLDFEDVK